MRLPYIPPPVWPMYRLTEEYNVDHFAIELKIETMHRGEKAYARQMIAEEYTARIPAGAFRRVIEEARERLFRKLCEEISGDRR